MSLARKSPVRVIIVDDSPAVRDLLAALMHSAGDILVVGMGSNGEDAVRLVKDFIQTWSPSTCRCLAWTVLRLLVKLCANAQPQF